MRERIINAVKHNLTARQVCAEMLAFFDESRQLPVCVIVPKGEGIGYEPRLRVEVTRAIKKTRNKHGIKVTGPFPDVLSDSDYGPAEVVVVRFNITPLQIMSNVIDSIPKAALTQGAV